MIDIVLGLAFIQVQSAGSWSKVSPFNKLDFPQPPLGWPLEQVLPVASFSHSINPKGKSTELVCEGFKNVTGRRRWRWRWRCFFIIVLCPLPPASSRLSFECIENLKRMNSQARSSWGHVHMYLECVCVCITTARHSTPRVYLRTSVEFFSEWADMAKHIRWQMFFT